MAKVKEILALLEELERENGEVQAEIERLIGEMETVPPERRAESEWGPQGHLTLRYLELTERQDDLSEDMRRVKQALEAAAPPKADGEGAEPAPTKH